MPEIYKEYVMPEEIAGTQPQPMPVASPAADVVPVARLNGALAKIQELTLQLQAANAALTQKDQEISRLSGDSAQREAMLKNDVSERDQKYTSLQSEVAKANQKVADLEAYKLKVATASKLKIPGIFDILDVIPAGTDEASQEVIMQRFGTFASSVAQTREKELLAGNTGPVIVQPAGPEPQTTEAWAARINALPLGSPERAAAMENWRKFTFK